MAGCSTRADQSRSEAPQTLPDSAEAPTRGATATASPIPHPSPPYDTCTGATSYAAVLDLVTGGRATLFVKATVTGDAAKDGPNSKVVPVQDVTVLAGEATAGIPEMISHTELEQYNDLPRGTYLLLLSHFEGSDSTYSLAFGLPGSFATDGDMAFQRCAHEADPSHPIRAEQGTTIDDLASNVQKAFDATNFGPEPTSYPRSASTR